MRWPNSSELEPVCEALGERATLKLFEDADHSFHVPARTGRKDAEVLRRGAGYIRPMDRTGASPHSALDTRAEI